MHESALTKAAKAKLAQRVFEAAMMEGHFTLRSGARSTRYFDKYQIAADPHLLGKVADALLTLVPPGTQALAGLELGAIPLVTLMSQRCGLPVSFIRKQAKTYGTCRYAEGASLAGKRFVLVEDVISSGGAVLDALSLLSGDGLKPDAVLCVLNRHSGGCEAIAAQGAPVQALFSMNDAEFGVVASVG